MIQDLQLGFDVVDGYGEGVCGHFDEVFEVRPSMFDWVEVWRVGRQADQCRPRAFDHLSDIIALVPRGVIHNHGHAF